MMPQTSDRVRLESERVYVVHDGRSGEIAHVHRVLTFQGGTAMGADIEEARALEMAGRFGHRVDRLRVLRVDGFDPRLAQRVDVKARRLTAASPQQPGVARAAKRPIRRAKR